MRLFRLPVLTLLVLLVPAAAAEAKVYDVREELANQIDEVAPATNVPIRLPVSINLGYDGQIFGEGIAGRRDYDLDLSGAPQCNHATACFMAHFSGERGGSLVFRRRVALANGITGRYKPIGCGASCSPPMVEWKQGGYLYRIQAKVPAGGRRARRMLVRLANQSIRSTPL